MSCPHRPQGFTLIEVLVALTLLALLSLISWRGLDAMQQGGERLDARARDTLSIVHALSQLERDVLLHAGADVLPPAAPPPAGLASSAQDHPGLALPGIAWSPDTGLRILRAAGEGRWQALHWYLKDGVLYRAAGPAGFAVAPAEARAPVPVVERVADWTVRFWRPGLGWVAAGQTQGIPSTADAYTGVEITIRRQGADEAMPYRKVVVLG